MQTLNYRTLYVLLALTWSGMAAAQLSEEEELALIYGDKATISLATGSRQPIARAPAVATVITAQEIEAMGATDLDQALASVPGLHVSMSSVAMNPIYGFRGIATRNNPQMLMLVNGIPITNVYWGDRSQIWGGMPLENIARIEIIRGPGSALYGADAFSGVINVITKTAANIRGTEYGLRAGSFNTKDAWIQHGGELGALDAAFYLRVGDTDGSQGIAQQDAQTVWDGIFGTTASLAPGPINTVRKAIDARADLSFDAWRFRAAYQQRDVGIGAGLAGALDPNGRGYSARTYLDLSYEQANWAPNWDMSAVLGIYDNQEKSSNQFYTLFPARACIGLITNCFPNGMLGGPGHSERHTHGSVSTVYSGFERHRVRIGAGFRVEDMYETSELKNFNAFFAMQPALVQAAGNPALVYMLPHKRNLTYAFAQDEWSFTQDWTLTAGVRHDRYSDFGGTTNPRIALVWDASYNVTVKAMHGTAFRAPSFSEQYSINNPVAVGSPNIKPETIATDELAISWQPTGDLETKLNFFHYRMRNIILADPVTKKYQNAGDQTGRGLELEATWDVAHNLRLNGNYSLQHSTDGATGQDAGMAPHRRLFGRADWQFASFWQLGATVNHVAGRMREPGDPRALVPDYTTVDLTLQREKFAGGWDARAAVTNLFDRKAWEPTFSAAGTPSDLPLPGRAFYIQLQHKL
ncbi:MAG: TonB-dependent receptor [Gallionella sp.]